MTETAPLRGTILLAEDNPHQREILTRLARPLTSGELLAAEHGADALARLEGRDELELLITDLQMPVMDGVALLRHVAERGLSPMIVLVSAEHSSILTAAERVAKAYGLRLLGSVAKPVTRAALHALVMSAQGGEAGQAPVPPVRVPGPSVPALSADEIRTWIERGHLSVDLQPKLDLASGAVGGAEALARLFSPVARTRIPPGRFVPVIETDRALTTDFTLAVTRCVTGALAAWPVGMPPPTLSINLPGSSLADAALADRLAGILEQAGIAPARIVWEVTETAALESMGAAIEILTRLRLKGSGLSTDDYGTGHSSLDRLAAIPFTEVKLDRAFVHGCAADRSARTIIASTVQLAHDLGMRCVAEGAETDDEVEVLRDLGCDAVQGYAVARPMPVDEFAAWCHERSAGTRVA